MYRKSLVIFQGTRQLLYKIKVLINNERLYEYFCPLYAAACNSSNKCKRL